MLETNRYSVINIRRYLNSDNPKLGESRLLQVLSGFSCPRNPDVERFLKKSSVEFTKKNQSVTYLVFDISSMVLVGYFTLALKPLTVRGETVSNTVKRKLLRVSELDEISDTYTMSAYLIAQLGKNFTNGEEKKITGEELLVLAWDKIKEIQSIWAVAWLHFWKQKRRKSCYHFIVVTVFRSLIPDRPHRIQMSRMSWYSF